MKTVYVIYRHIDRYRRSYRIEHVTDHSLLLRPGVHAAGVHVVHFDLEATETVDDVPVKRRLYVVCITGKPLEEGEHEAIIQGAFLYAAAHAAFQI